MRKLIYLGLEPYNARYTLQLTDWNVREFKRLGVDYEIVNGQRFNESEEIQVGEVLDAYGRSYFAMSQMQTLLGKLAAGHITSDDAIFFEDMFHPGIESLPYLFNQSTVRPKVYVRCLAQTVDPDDFVHTTGMTEWMTHYERMVNSFVDGVLASNEEMVAHMKIAGWTAPMYNIAGLAFGKAEVIERVDGDIKPFAERTMRVAFSSRWCAEKQPNFYMDLAELYKASYPDVEFCIMQGSKLKDNEYTARLNDLVARGVIKVYDNLAKNTYYSLLNDTRVLFNCALQDWTSNTVSEADALGANVLFPAYRSFPETFNNDADRLYVPWSLQDAASKLDRLLRALHVNAGKISDHNDKTIERTVAIMSGNGAQYERDATDYRKHILKQTY